MSVEVTVPSVGESISEVTIGQWNKQDGDYVEKDDVLCELESDKATFELNAEASGILKIVAQEGDTVAIGGLICKISPSENKETSKAAPSESSSASPAKETHTKPTGEVVDMVVPQVGESISEVTIASWSKEDGSFVQKNDLLCEIESDKATFELTAENSGILKIVAQEGETLEIGALICKIEVTEGGTVSSPSAAVQSAQTGKTSADGYASGHASPAASKILAEKGITTSSVTGSGKDGRVTKEDALKAEKKSAPSSAAKAETPSKAQTPSAVPGSRNQDRKRMSSLRKTIAKRLVSVKNETAMLTTFNEVDMKPIMDIRKKYKDLFKEKHDVGLGFMSFFTKACCQALLEWPAVNAQIDGDEMVYNDFCDISVAVSTPKGLVVPVIRNAEGMNFQEVEKEILRLAARARDGQLTIPEMSGGTFTITNGGVFGSMMSTPIINAPQSAILGMHNIVERAVVINGEITIRPMMYVALSYDHRIIDGRESVSFLVRVKQLLEDPMRLLLGV